MMYTLSVIIIVQLLLSGNQFYWKGLESWLALVQNQYEHWSFGGVIMVEVAWL